MDRLAQASGALAGRGSLEVLDRRVRSAMGELTDLAADPDAPAMALVTHHVEEVPPGFSHGLLLSEGKVVAAGLLTDVLTAENLSTAFGQRIALEMIDGRYFARRVRARAAHRRHL